MNEGKAFNEFTQIATLADNGTFLVGQMIDGDLKFRQLTKQGFIDQFVSPSNELAELTDVELTSLAQGAILAYNGTKWVNLPKGTANQLLGVNAGATEQEYKTMDFVQPEWYGAVGDGTTDDTTAIQNAINSGFKVRFSAKTYKVNSALTLPSNAYIQGEKGGTIILAGSQTALFTATSVTNVSIKDLTIYGNASDVPFVSPDVSAGVVDSANDAVNQVNIGSTGGIFLSGSNRCKIENCEIRNFSRYGIRLTGGFGNNITGCNVHDCYIGVYYDTQAEYHYLSNSTIRQNQLGVYCRAGNNIFSNSHLGSNRVGFVLTSGVNDAHGSIVGCTFNHCSLYSFLSDQVSAGEIITGCQFWYGDLLIRTSRNITISDSQFRSNILFEGAFDADPSQVTGCVFRDGTITQNYNSSTSNVILRNNYFYDGSDATTINPLQYITGTFTPSINFGGVTTGITYSTQSGTYTRIGNQVFIDIAITLSSKGSAGSGNLALSGLPINVKSGVNTPLNIYLVGFSSLTGAPFSLALSNSANIGITQSSATGTTSPITFAMTNDTSIIRISGNYSIS